MIRSGGSGDVCACVEVDSGARVEDSAFDVDASEVVTVSVVVGVGVVDAGAGLLVSSLVVALSGVEVVLVANSVHSPQASLQYISMYLGFL